MQERVGCSNTKLSNLVSGYEFSRVRVLLFAVKRLASSSAYMSTVRLFIIRGKERFAMLGLGCLYGAQFYFRLEC